MARTRIVQPTIRQWILASAVRDFRAAKGWTLGELAERLGCIRAYAGQYERAERRLPEPRLRALLREGSWTEEQKEFLLDLLIDSRGQICDNESGWLQSTYLPLPWESPHITLYKRADRVCALHQLIFPDVLQAPAYAEAIVKEMQQLRRHNPHRGLPQILAVRLTDQQQPLAVHAVFGEAVFHIPIANMRAQFDHVLALMELPNVTVQALTFDAPVATNSVSFELFGFDRPQGNSGVSYDASLTHLVLADDFRTIGAHKNVWERIVQRALSPAETAELIRQYRATHTRIVP